MLEEADLVRLVRRSDRHRRSKVASSANSLNHGHGNDACPEDENVHTDLAVDVAGLGPVALACSQWRYGHRGLGPHQSSPSVSVTLRCG